MRSLVRARPGRGRRRSTWTARRSATWRPVSRAGRVLLTHLQMGYDRDATIESVRARFDGPVELVDPGFETTISA